MAIQLSDEAISKLIEMSLTKTYGESAFVGKNVYIRTVTFHYTGKLVSENASWLTIEDAAWIADSGRWADALNKGTLSEVEPFPSGQVQISRDTIVDVSIWDHDLPRTQQ